MRLLIIGKLSGQMSEASQIAMSNGAKVTHADGATQGLNILRLKGADLIMMEVGLDIAGFLQQIRSEHISTPLIACGIGSDPDAAVEAIRAGAQEYVPLPPDAALIAAVIESVADDSHPLIYSDPAMDNVIKLADQIAKSDASIMITGESGTGKEIMARYVHKKSARSNRQFVTVNCAAIPENLLESELFGHEKGAFTGAVARRVGKFEEANGGTLLLDEITEMDLRLQAKLLRAIQEREIDRVGGNAPVKVDIRILATSNRDLQDEVKKGNFREDLWFRLNVVNLAIPPLRQRPADIKVLVGHFAEKYAKSNGFPAKPVDETAMQALLSHPWQGNVRELENTVHRAVLLSTGDSIGANAILLPDGSRPERAASAAQAAEAVGSTDGATTDALVGRTVADVERDLIIDTLQHCLGNRTHAANILGISIRTLRNKLNQYQTEGVAVPAPGEGQRVGYGH
ncbi:MAG: sigma-54 dependent transcriptional regulator [Pseudomonadota bacterium]